MGYAYGSWPFDNKHDVVAIGYPIFGQPHILAGRFSYRSIFPSTPLEGTNVQRLSPFLRLVMKNNQKGMCHKWWPNTLKGWTWSLLRVRSRTLTACQKTTLFFVREVVAKVSINSARHLRRCHWRSCRRTVVRWRQMRTARKFGRWCDTHKMCVKTLKEYTLRCSAMLGGRSYL